MPIMRLAHGNCSGQEHMARHSNRGWETRYYGRPPIHRLSHPRMCSAAGVASPSSGAYSGVRSNNMAIEVQGLSHSFGDRQVLRSADLSVNKGTLHILAGANGCGKSTLLRILGRLLERQAGSVRVDTPVGMVLQNPDHQIVMPTVAAEVAFGLGRYSLSSQTVARLVKEALEAVDLQGYGDRPTNTLSGGEKQRVAIAGALVVNPKVLLLDELTTFLDDGGQKAVMRAVRAAVDGPRRVTALWVTHRLEELQWADAASFIDEGRVEVSGSPQRVLDHMRGLGAHA